MGWDPETLAPSRLGEETNEVLLGRWEGDALRPWRTDKPPTQAWSYSTVRVAERLIAGAAPFASSKRNTEVRRQLDRLPGAGRWVILLGLDQDLRGFFVKAQAAAHEGTPATTHTWRYDNEQGLRIDTDVI